MMRREEDVELIKAAFLRVSENFLDSGVTLKELRSVAMSSKELTATSRHSNLSPTRRAIILPFILPAVCLAVIIKLGTIDYLLNYAYYESRCLVANNYFVWEFTRPVSNCDFCRGVKSALILDANLTREEFAPYAYSSRPMIVKSAASHWPAANVFDLKFFRNLYESIDGAYESVEEECQFLHFKSNFAELRQVLEMNEGRALNRDGEDSWYVGWKNCHPQVLEALNHFYRPPHFLPDDAEIPRTNYVFIGYDQGAIMHLDYIPRLMWQGQIRGSKTWSVVPTPECENICQGFNFSVATGDVILLDTRIWYHATYVEDGGLSVTITSEYG